jgi:hypothetical protein
MVTELSNYTGSPFRTFGANRPLGMRGLRTSGANRSLRAEVLLASEFGVAGRGGS